MADGKFRFSWSALGNVVKPGKQEGVSRGEPAGESPWMLLAANGGRERTGSHRNDSGVGRFRQPSVIESQSESLSVSSQGTSRWLSEMNSPYGYSDDDGTQKEIESSTWRRTAPPRRSQRFIPRTDGPKSRVNPASTNERPGGSTWVLQLFAAIALAGCGIYAHSGQTTLAAELNSVFENAYTTDYSTTAWPAISNFLTRHHLSVPSFTSSKGALVFHVPLDGTIVSDYSKDNSRITLQGASGELVFADGNGTVSKVMKLDDGYMVTIVHSNSLLSQYFGLGTVNVKAGQSVQSGQSIAKLKSVAKAKMQFGIVKNGAYLNPHDFIQFSDSTGSA